MDRAKEIAERIRKEKAHFKSRNDYRKKPEPFCTSEKYCYLMRGFEEEGSVTPSIWFTAGCGECYFCQKLDKFSHQKWRDACFLKIDYIEETKFPKMSTNLEQINAFYFKLKREVKKKLGRKIKVYALSEVGKRGETSYYFAVFGLTYDNFMIYDFKEYWGWGDIEAEPLDSFYIKYTTRPVKINEEPIENDWKCFLGLKMHKMPFNGSVYDFVSSDFGYWTRNPENV